MLAGILFIFALLVVVVLPGAAWLFMIRPQRLDPLEWLAEMAGASLALTGVLALYFSLAGIRLGAAGVVGLYAVVLVLAVGWVVYRRQSFRLGGWTILAVGAALAVVAWRFYQARELVLPPWVDSVHHVLLVRTMVEFGGLPPDWMPYLPAPMFYHYGFHILAASFTFWGQMEPAQAVLLLGQVLNAAVAFSVYRLAKAAWGDPRLAGLAGLLTAFGFHMPAYYLTWGRYPLLAGLALLPLAMAALLEARRDPRDRSAWLRLALYTAGVCVCHYLVVGLLGLFGLVMLSAEALRCLRARSLRLAAWQPFAAALAGGILALPWLARVWSYSQAQFALSLPNPLDVAGDQAGLWEYLIYLTGPQRSHILMLLAGIGLLYLLLRRRVGWLPAWSLLLLILATPYGPRFEPFRPDHLAIVLFLPASLLVSAFFSGLGQDLAAFLQRRWSQETTSTDPAVEGRGARARRYALAACAFLPLLAGAGFSAWGIAQTANILNPVTVLALPADLYALRWVEAHTPPEARFFINATGWQGSLYRGVDGGFWLMPAAGRFSVVPPVAFAWSSPDDLNRFLDWSRRAAEVKACDDSFWSLVGEAGLTHVYLRSGVGNLQPSALQGCPGVELIYEQEGVSIYALH